MTQIVNTAGAVGGDHGRSGYQRDERPQGKAGEMAVQGVGDAENPDIRLTIESDEAAGEFVYRTIDRRTGSVIRQLRRERLLQIGEAADYAAGSLIKTSA